VVAPEAGARAIAPDTLADELNADGDCSLREALQSANTNQAVDGCAKGKGGEPDVIKLTDSEYELTLASSDEDLNANGDLDYTGGGPLVIRGPKPGGKISSNVADRVLQAVDGAKSLSLERVQLEDGDAATLNPDNGGDLYVGEGSVRFDRVRLGLGSAPTGSGGGAFFSSDVPVRIDRSLIFSNEAIQGGGLNFLSDPGSRITRTTFIENSAATGAARGGAIAHFGKSLSISDSKFSSNHASSSGGGSALGGAIYGSDLDIRRSLFTGNDTSETNEAGGADGGAIRTFENTRVTNTTFYGNESADVGGAFRGGGKLSHVTFLSNSAEEGDHIAGNSTGSDLPLVVRNSILGGFLITLDPCAESVIISKGFNVAPSDDGDCSFRDSDLTDVSAASMDEFPSDHGGATDTIAIDADSPMRDLIPRRNCKPAQGEDQRGYSRPAGKRCDAGSFEFKAKP
jgi:CSLREA domain-containing protein